MITIYIKDTIIPRYARNVDDASRQSVGLMREDILTMTITLPTPVNFQIGDYCDFIGLRYQINRRPTRTRNEKNQYVYQIQMEGDMMEWRKVQFRFLDENNNFTEGIFPLRARLEDIGILLIKNMQRVFPTAGWQLGNVEDTGYMDFTFSAQSCLQVVVSAADAFGTEYLFEGRTLHLSRRQVASGLVLRQGEGLRKLTEGNRDNKDVVTRLYAYGSSKNLLASEYRGGAQYLRMGNIPYIEKNVTLYKTVEATVLFDGSNGNEEIYPHRTGTITAVDDPFNFYDASIDFDLNDYLLPAPTPAKVVFNTGLLNGYTFDIVENGFNYATKKITIKKNDDEKNLEVPSATLTPRVGDQYVFVDVRQPQQYITKAENDLKTAAQKWLDINSIPAYAYSAECDPRWFKKNNVQLRIGDTVTIVDDDLNINVTTRITAFTRSLNDPYLYTIEFSDTVEVKPLINKLLNTL